MRLTNEVRTKWRIGKKCQMNTATIRADRLSLLLLLGPEREIQGEERHTVDRWTANWVSRMAIVEFGGYLAIVYLDPSGLDLNLSESILIC